jgi:hypothetical protein
MEEAATAVDLEERPVRKEQEIGRLPERAQLQHGGAKLLVEGVHRAQRLHLSGGSFALLTWPTAQSQRATQAACCHIATMAASCLAAR